VQSEEGIVCFLDKKERKTISGRFEILLKIPDLTKLYFQTSEWWDEHKVNNEPNWPEWITSRVLSNVTHGFQSNNSSGTKQLLFQSPFFIIFKSNEITSNFLSFVDFQKPNTEDTILCMLLYDEEHDIFYPQFQPELILPYLNALSLNNVLEFKLIDSKKQVINVSDKSQLFIVLSIL
jgi:hypothetical protein